MTRKDESYKKRIDIAMKRTLADLVFKNATYLNVFTNEFLRGDIALSDDTIAGIGSYHGVIEIDCSSSIIVPGFIDGHIHLESTAVRPDEFVKAALPRGTTTVIVDPHEIANVLGTIGIDYMLQATASLPMDIYFMLPSCVPCSPFDEAGAVLHAEHINEYLSHDRVLGLAEMMNIPGVIYCDPETLSKTYLTLQSGKLIDGHAPGVSSSDLMAYVSSGIYSDHECTSFTEAIEKIRAGQWIMIREGTASKDLSALLSLCQEPYASRCMFATDDRHINDLLWEGHIDHIIRSAIAAGISPAIAYKMASFIPATYFQLTGRGAIAPGYRADIILLDDLTSVAINAVYKNGIHVTNEFLEQSCKPLIDETLNTLVHNTIHMNLVTPNDITLKRTPEKIIGLIEHQLLTTDEGEASCIDIENDILKVCVSERHKQTNHIGVCLIKGYGLKRGAIATSVAHDSHNIIAVGTSDEDIAYAINTLHDLKGGMVVVDKQTVLASFALPIAGLMSDLPAKDAANELAAIRKKAYELGVNPEIDPFMTLSFVSLPVIPKLKLTSLGVVDVDQFRII